MKISNDETKTEHGHSGYAKLQSHHASILPSAKATTMAVVSAAQHEYELEITMEERKRMLSQSSQSDTSHIDPLEQNTETPNVKRKRPKFIRKVICEVCGDVANDHMHYGAIACYSCRAFFRRSVACLAPYFCSINQCCPITKQTRKHCQSCRFQKCLAIGMKRSSVMTEEEKLEKKKKAKIRRRWNEIKKYDRDTASNRKVSVDAEPNQSNLQTSSETTDIVLEISVQKLDSIPCYSSSSYNASVKISNDKTKTEHGHSGYAKLQSHHSSILPSATTTTTAVELAGQHEYELEITMEDNTIPFDENQILGWQDVDTAGNEVLQGQMKGFPTSYANHNENMDTTHTDPMLPYNLDQENMDTTHTSPMLPYNLDQLIPSAEAVLNLSQDSDNSMNWNASNTRDGLTFGDISLSNDSMKEYHPESSKPSQDLCQDMVKFSPVLKRTLSHSLSSLLLKKRRKLPYGPNLLNDPVTTFTREESNLVSNVIAIEEETTHQMPISNETLRLIIHSVKTGTSLSYQATLEGYTVCMKRIIKFASRIDLFREFCLDDQKSLLLSNMFILVNIRSASTLRPGFNLQDQLSAVYGGKRELPYPTTLMSSEASATKRALQTRREYQQVYSSPWTSGEDQDKRFFEMMNTILELQIDQTTTALITMMALFSQVNKYLRLAIYISM